MRLCRFTSADFLQPHFAIVEGQQLVVLKNAFYEGVVPSGQRVDLDAAQLLAPCEPSKVVCVGLNDRVHAKQMGKAIPAEPRLFIKASTTVIGPGQAIVLPPQSERVEHEAELGVVISLRASRVDATDAWKHVLGYTCVNDVTARDIQRSDGHYTVPKGFDSFCPLGPWIETERHPEPVAVRCFVNGELRQEGSSANLIRAVPELIAYISAIMTLLPGDVISTGTYGGTSKLNPGDIVKVQLEGVGELENPVIAA